MPEICPLRILYRDIRCPDADGLPERPLAIWGMAPLFTVPIRLTFWHS